jgi:hypothetical protein
MLHHLFLYYSPLAYSIYLAYGDDLASIWARLCQRFKLNVEERKTDLKEELNNLQMTEGTTIEQFLISLDVQLANISIVLMIEHSFT